MGGGQEVQLGARNGGSDKNATILKVDSVLLEKKFSVTEALVMHVDSEHDEWYILEFDLFPWQ